MDILKIKKNHILVSRGATGIYLIFVANEIVGKKVIVPANLCYAAIMPILISGNTPVFCDVDPINGNITYDNIKDMLSDAAALIAPHMYGNPIMDISYIANQCKEKGVLLIEDCASAMGAEVLGEMCGSFGDYVIYSTGYSKTIDLGYGGIVASDYDLDPLKRIYERLNYKSETHEVDENIISKFYRILRNNPGSDIEQAFWNMISYDFSHLFVYQDKDNPQIYKALNNIDSVISERREHQAKYYNLVTNPLITKYDFQEGAVPWRFCFTVDVAYKALFISYLLDLNIPVSDWYPSVNKIFRDINIYAGAERMGKAIINLPLLVSESVIEEYCHAINCFKI